jgi:hypothetical protein
VLFNSSNNEGGFSVGGGLSAKQMGRKLLRAITSLPPLELGKATGKVRRIQFTSMEFDWGVLDHGDRKFHFFQGNMNRKPLRRKVKDGLMTSFAAHGTPFSKEPGFRGSYVDVVVTCSQYTADLWILAIGSVDDDGRNIGISINGHGGDISGEDSLDSETRQIIRDYLNRLQGVAQYMWDEANAKMSKEGTAPR